MYAYIYIVYNFVHHVFVFTSEKYFSIKIGDENYSFIIHYIIFNRVLFAQKY